MVEATAAWPRTQSRCASLIRLKRLTYATQTATATVAATAADVSIIANESRTFTNRAGAVACK